MVVLLTQKTVIFAHFTEYQKNEPDMASDSFNKLLIDNQIIPTSSFMSLTP